MCQAVDIFDVRDMARFKTQIEDILGRINERSGNRYAPEVLFEHLRRRVIEREWSTALWLVIDRNKMLNGHELEDSICGLMTLDLFEDEIASPVTMISRAWCVPGMAATIWPVAKPLVIEWAKRRNCVRLQVQSERGSAWERWLRDDGFVVKEVILEAEIAGGTK